MNPYHQSQHIYLSSTAFYAPPRKREKADGGLLRRWYQKMVRAGQRRKMIAALQELDDDILRDIGIHRGEISSIVDGFDDAELGMTPVATATNRSWGNDGTNRWTV